jgi:hypothetical protein
MSQLAKACVLSGKVVRHQDRHLGRSIELAGALPLALSELAKQYSISTSQKVRLDIAQPQPMLREHLYQRLQLLVAQDVLPGSRLVEVLDINHARELRILARHRADGVGEELTQAVLLCWMAPQRASGGM